MWHTSIIPKGKILYVPKWTLECTVSPVIMVDQEVVSGNRLAEFGKEIKNFNNFKIDITYDQQSLYTGGIDQSIPIVVSAQLLDDKENTNHLLSIGLSGKTDDHSCFYQGKSVSLGVKLDLLIESVPMASTLLQVGLKNHMGENEIQKLEIKTPIYQWLLSNQEYIMRDIF